MNIRLRKPWQMITLFAALILALLAVLVYAAVSGSIAITAKELAVGLWQGNDERVVVIMDLRFPRMMLAMLVGAVLAVSGLLLQAVVRNPLADAGMLGISAGAGVTATVLSGLFPMLFYWSPLFAFVGGALAWLTVYTMARPGGLQPLRLVLTGIAVHMILTGVAQVLPGILRSSIGQVNLISSADFSQTTWADVQLLAGYGLIGLILAYVLFPACNVLALNGHTAQNLGLNVPRARLLISAVAVGLAGAAAAVGGFLFFVGLLVPAIARLCLGADHRWTLPFAALFGALLVLAADTWGRTLIPGQEIPASVIMLIVGGPCLLLLLRKGARLQEG